MALPVWPVTLPTRPLRDGYERGPRRGALQTEFEDGPDRLRDQSRIDAMSETVTMDMTPAQFVVFEAFYRDDLFRGKSRFTMPTIDAAGTITNRTVALVHQQGQRPYKATWTGATWRVSFGLTVYY